MAILDQYDQRLKEKLSAHPRAGTGHHWFYRIALHFRHYHSEEHAFQLLRAVADNWDRRVPDDEILKAVRKAYSQSPDEAKVSLHIQWPDLDAEAIAKVKSEVAPYQFQPCGATPAESLNNLFAPTDLVCVGLNQQIGKVATLAEVLADRPERWQYIVPSPMSKPTGLTQDGRGSFRCLDNTGKRKFLVVESDSEDFGTQAAVLTYLDNLTGVVNLSMVVHSGNKSLHGWFDVSRLNEAQCWGWFSYAVRLGADQHTFVRCQWVRMPGGTRYNGDGSTKTQEVMSW